MAYGNALHQLPQDLVTIFRKYEQTKRKEISAEWSMVFNETCLKENLWPTYTKDLIIMTLLDIYYNI